MENNDRNSTHSSKGKDLAQYCNDLENVVFSIEKKVQTARLSAYYYRREAITLYQAIHNILSCKHEWLKLEDRILSEARVIEARRCYINEREERALQKQCHEEVVHEIMKAYE